MRADPTTNFDPRGECSSPILEGDALQAACRRLVSACLRRWALINSVEAGSVGFVPSRDLADASLTRYYRLARDTQNGAVIRGMLDDDPVLRALFWPPVELGNGEAVALTRQIVRSRRAERNDRGRYLHLPAVELIAKVAIVAPAEPEPVTPVAPSSVPEPVKDPVDTLDRATQLADARAAMLLAMAPTKKAKNGFDRKAYQREYRRKRRAAQSRICATEAPHE